MPTALIFCDVRYHFGVLGPERVRSMRSPMTMKSWDASLFILRLGYKISILSEEKRREELARTLPLAYVTILKWLKNI